jgi:RND superfamily putative drug exporter
MLLLEQWVERHRRLVLVLWALAFVAAAPLAAQQSDHLTGGGFKGPRSESGAVTDSVNRDFPSLSGATLTAVLEPGPGATAGDVSAAVLEVRRKARGVHGLGAALPAAHGGRDSGGAAAVLLPWRVVGDESRATDVGRDLRVALGIDGADAGRAGRGRVALHVIGQGALFAAFQQEAQKRLSIAEARAFPLIALVLLTAFGSLVASILPLGLGVAGVTISGALVYLLSLEFTLSVFVTSIASMLGLAVAVDYSLFVLARYREEVRDGADRETARSVAMATSGIAVVFSGLTVAVSVASLLLIRSPALESIAVGAILVVAVAVLAASTLLPALIALAGRRADGRGRFSRVLDARWPAALRARPDFWHRWTARVMARPKRSIMAAAAVLLVLAAPAVGLRMGNSVLRQLGSDHEYRAGVRVASEVAGPGALGPAQVVVVFPSARDADPAVVRAIRQRVAADPSVRKVDGPVAARDGSEFALTAVLRQDPEAENSRDAVDRLRREVGAEAGGAAHARVGGTTAALVDFDRFVSGSMWRIVLFILVLSFVVLVVLLRSLLLPLKAVLTNLLSVAAGYGVMVAIFQWGWLDFLGFESTQFIDTIIPPVILVVAFGLSMDYSVFLLSRIRERYAATGDNQRAVAEGLASSAHTITSAALIMVVVFLAFVSAGVLSVQRLGIATATAVAVDATLVRLVLVPAMMQVFGKWNWWLPKWLDALLPGDGAAAPAPTRPPEPVPVASGGRPE